MMKKTITSIEKMTLILHGMRGTHLYEITEEGGKTALQQYREVFLNREKILELERGAVCDTEVFLALMNACDVILWDGFHGEHPKDVRDGIMFDLKAIVNGGHTIRAEGSANFPKGYHEFVCELNRMLAENKTR